MGKAFRLGVDTGGTFTDLCLIEESSGSIEVCKVASNPSDPAAAVIDGLKKLTGERGLKPEEVSFVIHGTTVATNALLEGKGAPAALITTGGFEDILLIGRQNRPHIYNSRAKRPTPVVPRNFCFGVSERTLYTGKILKPLDPSSVLRTIEEIKRRGIVSIAVCLLHSYANPSHERMVKELIKEKYPEALVTLSSEILPEFREYERTSTTCINAYVMPRVSGYIAHLDEMLKDARVASDLYIMQSNGGVITSRTARDESARTVLSGPAGGALTGVYLARLLNEPNVITIDMGGTSSDICLIESGQPRLTSEADIQGYPIKLPMIDINTIGAGGGSMAWIDPGGALRVGPVSAGAVPGPVCYGLGGTEPTVTDANVVLGRINPGYLLGGEMAIDGAKAAKTIEEKIAKPLGLDLLRAAEGIIAVVNANMIRGIRRVSVERGFDPRDFILVPFGGAGPLHGVDLARALNMSRVIVPPHPGIASAFGMLSADVRHDYVRTFIAKPGHANMDSISSIFLAMEDQADNQLAREGFSDESVVLSRSVDMRYSGQSYELEVVFPSGGVGREAIDSAIGQFHQIHERSYGYMRAEQSVELVNLRLVALGKLPAAKPSSPGSKRNGPVEPFSGRAVYFDAKKYETPVYNRDDLAPGLPVYGPAIVEQLDSTIVIPPGFRAEVEPMGNMIITEENRK